MIGDVKVKPRTGNPSRANATHLCIATQSVDSSEHCRNEPLQERHNQLLSNRRLTPLRLYVHTTPLNTLTICLSHSLLCEPYDAELLAIMRGIRHPAPQHCCGRNFSILIYMQAAMRRIQSDAPGRGNRLSTHCANKGTNTLTVKWVPDHTGTAGNEAADA